MAVTVLLASKHDHMESVAICIKNKVVSSILARGDVYCIQRSVIVCQ
jgi:hypothetical protein